MSTEPSALRRELAEMIVLAEDPKIAAVLDQLLLIEDDAQIAAVLKEWVDLVGSESRRSFLRGLIGARK